MESMTKKNLFISLGILFFLYTLQVVKIYLFGYGPLILENFFRALGAFLPIIALPLVIALILKIFKGKFWNMLWVLLVIISIPLSLLSFYGAYLEYNKKLSEVHINRGNLRIIMVQTEEPLGDMIMAANQKNLQIQVVTGPSIF